MVSMCPSGEHKIYIELEIPGYEAAFKPGEFIQMTRHKGKEAI